MPVLSDRVAVRHYIALPMSKDCCHATSASNVYTAAWQRDHEAEGSARAMCYCLNNYSLL